MTLTEQIQQDVKDAMRAKAEQRLSVLRMLQAALTNERIALKKRAEGLSDTEVLAVIQRELKKRADAAKDYAAGERTDLAAKEQSEMAILSTYVPPALRDEEIEGIVAKGIADTNATTPKDMGKVMQAIKSQTQGRVDGAKLAERVRKALGAEQA